MEGTISGFVDQELVELQFQGFWCPFLTSVGSTYACDTQTCVQANTDTHKIKINLLKKQTNKTCEARLGAAAISRSGQQPLATRSI